MIYIIIFSISTQRINADISNYIRYRHRLEFGCIVEVSEILTVRQGTAIIRGPESISYLCGKLLHSEDEDCIRKSELSTRHRIEAQSSNSTEVLHNESTSNETSSEINFQEYQYIKAVSTGGRGRN